MAFNIFKKKETKKDDPEQAKSQDSEVKPENEKQPAKLISNAVTTLEPEYEEIMALGEKKPLINDPIESLLEDNIPITDIIAPKKIETDFDYVVVNDVFFRTLFASAYPRFVSAGWLEQIINFNSSLDVSFFIYPIEIKGMLDDLRHKIAEMEAELATDIERGKIVDPFTTSKLEDAQGLQEELVKGSEHIFEFAFYITIKAANLEQLNQISKLVVSTLSALPVTVKHATLDMSNAFITSLPLAVDNLSITRNMDTTALATTFPFTSTELSSDTGILYGINPQNDSFIIFDRFSLENSNMTIFATSGAGKSLSYHEEVIYKDKDNEIKKQKIGEVVEQIIKQEKLVQIDEETEGVIDPNIQVFTFNDELKVEWAKVQIAARKTAPDVMYKIKTRSGREINITADHCLITLQNGKIVATKGENVNKGDYIPLPRKISQTNTSNKKIDVEKLLRLSGIKVLKKKNGRIGNRIFTDKTSLPLKIELSSSLFEILGLFTAEGMVNKDRALISTTSKEVFGVAEKFYKKIGITYSYIKKDNKIVGIYISVETFCRLLKQLGASGKSHEKRVPSLVFSSSDDLVANYLKAYFEGDGSVDGHEISATTKSKVLASDLSYLLLRFGIITRLSKTKKSATNKAMKKWRSYYKLRISGQDNIRKFIENIGFISKRKNDLVKLLIKIGNTNVDTIPDIGSVFEEIYNVLYQSPQIPAPNKFSEIKLGKFNPSPAELKNIIEKIEQRIKQIEELETDGLSTLHSLPTVQEIIEASTDKHKNRLLWNKLGKTWWTMKKGVSPKLQNTLKAISITHDQSYTTTDISGAIYRSYKHTGESLRQHDSSLWSAIINAQQDPIYDKVIKARDHIVKKYKIKKDEIKKIKEKVNWLKTLAYSDLFWDKITEIKKVDVEHDYVYDLQVENEVFLAGHGGLFVHNSYLVKLESVRYLMLGTEIIIIDPENEYQTLSDAVGGQYIEFSYDSKSKINPFDLSQIREKGVNQLGIKILSLLSLLKIITGDISAQQEALLDRAINEAYRAKGITQDPDTQDREPPLMEDLYKALVGLETEPALDLAARLEKYVKGSFVGIFDQQTNIDINNSFTAFGIKNLEDALRPIAMFMILDYIWTRIRYDLKPRILIVDEAWHMMRYETSAQFLFSIAKRARKYYLGLTTITQDVEDFLSIDIGRAVVNNSALRVLLKQSPAAIDRVSEVFYLSQGEQQLLLGANIGEGIFFAGANHSPIHIVASPEEHQLITTNPKEILERRNRDK